MQGGRAGGALRRRGRPRLPGRAGAAAGAGRPRRCACGPTRARRPGRRGRAPPSLRPRPRQRMRPWRARRARARRWPSAAVGSCGAGAVTGCRSADSAHMADLAAPPARRLSTGAGSARSRWRARACPTRWCGTRGSTRRPAWPTSATRSTRRGPPRSVHLALALRPGSAGPCSPAGLCKCGGVRRGGRWGSGSKLPDVMALGAHACSALAGATGRGCQAPW
jgi:hypothetical protein